MQFGSFSAGQEQNTLKMKDETNKLVYFSI